MKMNWMDLGINLVESILFAWLISRFVDIDKEKKIYFYIVYCLVITLETSISNCITIYDGLYTWIFVFFSYFIICSFQDNENRANPLTTFIFIIILDTLLSAGNEILFLLFYYFKKITPDQFTTLPILSRFLISRFFFAVSVYVTAKYSQKYKTLENRYNFFFLFVFSLILIATTLIEKEIVLGNPYFLLLIYINLTLFIVVLVLYYLFCKSSYDNFQLTENRILTTQLQNIQAVTQEFKEKEKTIRTMKHDLKNQLIAIDGYLKTGDIEKCREQIQNDLSMIEKLPAVTYTGKPAVDAILSSKIMHARNKEISVTSVTEIQDFSQETEYDVALILGNLLDNAIENISADKKEIVLKISQRESGLEINVKNTTDAKKLDLKTQKRDTENHGLGLNSVKLLCEKHDGFLAVDLYERYFYATAVLKNNL